MFKNETEKVCATCEHASHVYPSDTLYCDLRGPVEEFGCCRKYRFDALKYRPAPVIPVDLGAGCE